MLSETFLRARTEGRAVFIPYIMAGDPTAEASYEIFSELSRLGAEIIELGIPFSDPIADGPTIATAAQRALGNGMTAASSLELATRCGRAGGAKLVLFSYYNPILQFGISRFAREAARAGISGVIVPDLPLEHSGALRTALRTHNLDMPLLIAPNTNRDRVRRIVQSASGFVYVVTRLGVTGGNQRVQASDLAARIATLRELTVKPLALGFGLREPEQIQEMAASADAVIVGSALINAYVGRPAEHAAAAVGNYASELMSRLQAVS